MKKIVFISSSTDSPRVYKRIDEFIEHGFEVELYAFQRETSDKLHETKTFSYPIHHLGVIAHQRYGKRFFKMYKELKKVFYAYSQENVFFYFFMLDIAIPSSFFCKKRRYFYEESDLVHTYISNSFIKWILEKMNKRIIRFSLQTIFTSEGFVHYHFGEKKPSNVTIIPNKLNQKIKEISILPKEDINIQHLKIGFIGFPRYDTIPFFGLVIAEKFPQHEFHIFGNVQPSMKEKFDALRHFPNVFFHGSFANPDDLPHIYASIDLILSTYDTRIENVKFAEPNKLYEAIFFETPIIVSENTFLASRVSELNIGYAVNPFSETAIFSLIQNLSLNSLNDKILSCRKIDKTSLINDNTFFFNNIKRLKNFL